MRKLRVIFVAGFTTMKDGGVGGQLAASTTLAASELSSLIEFIPIDSTMSSITGRTWWLRLSAAIRRLITFVRNLGSADVVLIFAAHGASLAEKGLMCLLAKIAGRGVVLRLSSGYVKERADRYPLERWMLTVAFRSSNVILSQGAYWTEQFLQFKGTEGKIVEFPNPVATKAFGNDSPRPSTSKRLLFVGWIDRAKGVFDLLNVFEDVLHKHPDATLTLAGAGADYEKFRNAVKLAGFGDRVLCPGWIPRDKVSDLYLHSDIFVFPSYGEGMPNALLEAMVAGLGVVTTNVGAIPDLVRNGDNGFLCVPGDVSALTAATLRLLDDPALREAMGRRAHASVVAKYDVQRVWPIVAKALCRAAYESERRSTIIYEAPEF